ncbi:MAG: transcription antiterminator [Oscillospiraceae bacterium]|nr:transcription antiterminator [Oscillospiraceae bacterium]
MADRKNTIVQILLAQNRQLNASQLASQLGVSLRTLHNDLKQLNNEFPGVIISTPSGYQIDTEIAKTVLKPEQSSIPKNNAERCSFILNKLIQSGGSVNIYDLCDEIYISPSTFQTLLGRMRRLTREHDLTLTVAGEFITLSGAEKNKRQLISSMLYSESGTAFFSFDALQEAFPSIKIEEIRNDIIEVLNEQHYFINDYSLMNLLLHVAISINRIQNGYVNLNAVSDKVPLSSHEYMFADEIAQRLESRFNITFSDAEIYELTLLLVSRASSVDFNSITKDNIESYIGKDCLDLVLILIRTINEYYDIDLQEQEFFIRFALHIHNMLVRANNQNFCKNPLVSEIRQTCPLIYDVSVQLSGIILEQTGIVLNEDEIAYIALHLGGAMETQKEISRLIPAILYCPSYYNMNMDLAERISRKLSSQINLTNVYTSEQELSNIPKDVLLISTVRPHQVFDAPLVVISPFLTNTDTIALTKHIEEINISNRKALLRKELSQIISPLLFEVGNKYSTRDKLLQAMCAKLIRLNYTDEQFQSDVWEREMMSSTSFGQVAIPHALKMRAKKTGMSIYISKTPLEWGDTNVSLVILLCFSPDERKIFYDIFEPLSMLLMDQTHLKNLLVLNDYDSFVNYLADHME